MRLSKRWLAQFTCEFYTGFKNKPSIGDRIKHNGCTDPKCSVIKVRDRDEQPRMPKII